MLVTLDDLKRKGGVVNVTAGNNREQYEWLLTVAEEECLAFAGLTLEGDYEETHQGATFYQLSYRPVKEITSVTSGGTDISYSYNPRTESIKVDTEDEITVSYSVGFSAVSKYESLKLAIMYCVQYWAKNLNSNAVGESSRSTDLGTVQIEQMELPLIVKNTLMRYKRQVF